MPDVWKWFGGAMKWTYLEPDLSGEGVRGTWPARASELKGGGRLVLTDEALLFCPLEMVSTRKAIDALLGTTPIPGSETIARLTGLGAGSVQVIPLADVASAERISGPSWARPPKVRLKTKVGGTLEFGVLAGVGYPNLSKTNDEAVADLLGKLRPLVGR